MDRPYTEKRKSQTPYADAIDDGCKIIKFINPENRFRDGLYYGDEHDEFGDKITNSENHPDEIYEKSNYIYHLYILYSN